MEWDVVNYWLIAVFIIGYLAIIFEHVLNINKTASALLMAIATWMLIFRKGMDTGLLDFDIFDGHIGSASQIIFFLIGAMTLVELIDSHRGFKIITDLIHTRSKRGMLWIVGLLAFFMSSVLDNLTTTIVMISLLRKIIHNPKERLPYGAAVVIAANAGGAWTPIGDVTTTMLWIKGQITTIAVMKGLFFPSLFSLIITLFLLGLDQRGNLESIGMVEVETKPEPGAKLVFFVGLGALVFVPIFKMLTGLPPFMGILLGVGVLWVITDRLHYKYERKKYLTIPYILHKIDISGVLFFLGILLAISSLEIMGLLKSMALWLDTLTQNGAVIATVIGLFSAIVDNVPIVAACTGMYDLQVVPPDAPFWQMVAYAAGTGGSILIIGSAAGVAFMGLERVDFLWYLRKISLTALTGYLAGMALYLFQQMIF